MVIDLRGHVAIVTGAGRGIGRTIALALAAEGASVVCGERNETLVTDLRNELAAKGVRGVVVQADVVRKRDIESLVGTALESFGKVEVLVNNAGVAPSGFVEDLKEDAWDENADVNLKGTFLCSQAVIPIMKRQRRGRIINAASFAAIVPSAGFAAYAASKAGVVSLTRVLAAELGPWDITVNAYSPGMIPTELNRFAQAPPAMQARLLDTLALRRWGRAEDVANLIVFLASDQAAYITGAHIDISGGKLAVQFPQAVYERAAEEAAK
jgi:3-oxoacyl-[acyl-carrier protein] reductase